MCGLRAASLVCRTKPWLSRSLRVQHSLQEARRQRQVQQPAIQHGLRHQLAQRVKEPRPVLAPEQLCRRHGAAGVLWANTRRGEQVVGRRLSWNRRRGPPRF